MILVRTTSQALAAASSLGDRLAAASGLPVAMLIDERQAPAAQCRHPKVSLTKAAYAELGLHLTSDVGWRCGDYGLYVARRLYPQVERFWLFEDDVRLTGDAEDLFRRSADRPDLDFVVARLAPARPDWWWWPHLSSSDAAPWRCFFPVVRISARAVDALYATRVKHSAQLSRKALWPNDEALVATTIVHRGFARADLNDLCPALYDHATFSYDDLLKAGVDDREADGPPRLLHPVLADEAYARKAARKGASHRPPSLAYKVRRAAARRVNSFRPW